MALFVEVFEQLSRDTQKVKKGNLPPLLSFFINGLIIVIAFLLSALLVFPFLVRQLNLPVSLSLVISFVVFVSINYLLGAIVAGYINYHK